MRVEGISGLDGECRVQGLELKGLRVGLGSGLKAERARRIYKVWDHEGLLFLL